MYKSLNNLNPAKLNDMFAIRDTGGVLRKTNYIPLEKPKMKTVLCKRNMRTRGVHYWSQLPDTIQSAPSLPIFKNRLEEYKGFANHNASTCPEPCTRLLIR